MSRGPGRIERTIKDLLAECPTSAFTTDEIIQACFPDESTILKKHRVSALRSLRKTSIGWFSEMISHSHGAFVIYNPYNLRSYAIGRTRAREWDESRRLSRSIPVTSKRAEEMLLGDIASPYPRDCSKWIRTDGPYPVAVARWNAMRFGDTAEAERLWERFKKLAQTAVYRPEAITGDIHPDFLQAAA